MAATYYMVYQYLRLFRILKLIQLLDVIKKRLLQIVNAHIYRQLKAGFDIGSNYLVGQMDIIRLINEIVEYPSIAKEIVEICEKNRIEILMELAHFTSHYHDVAIAVNTTHATRYVLNELRAEINALKSSGLLQNELHEKLLLDVEERIKHLSYDPTQSRIRKIVDVLSNVDWIADDDELHEFFKNTCTVVKFGKKEIINNVGDLPKGLYIIFKGTVKVFGKVFQNPYGHLPNTDSYHWFYCINRLEDYLSIGCVLGEIGFLTKQPYNTTAFCISEVEAFHIPTEIMNRAVEIYKNFEPPLLYKIWRSCAVKIACSVFGQIKNYQDWGYDRITKYLELAYLPNLEGCTNFSVTAGMNNVVLIQGTAIASYTGQRYIAPSYIPQNIGTLEFRDSLLLQPVLLIVGDLYAQEDGIERTERFSSTFKLTSKRMSILKYSMSHYAGSVKESIRADEQKLQNPSDLYTKEEISTFKDIILDKKKFTQSKFQQGEETSNEVKENDAKKELSEDNVVVLWDDSVKKQ